MKTPPGCCVLCSPYLKVPAVRTYTEKSGHVLRLCARHYEPLDRLYRRLERSPEEWGAVRAWRAERAKG